MTDNWTYIYVVTVKIIEMCNKLKYISKTVCSFVCTPPTFSALHYRGWGERLTLLFVTLKFTFTELAAFDFTLLENLQNIIIGGDGKI